MNRIRPQILLFTYHKSGTTLFNYVFRKLADRLGLSMTGLYGMTREIDPTIDIVLTGHSLLGCEPLPPFRAVRAVRDPRDIWVSGYLYHLRTREPWCVNTDFDPTPPIVYPRVDFSFQHWPERWKRSWLARLDSRSYQQNLLDRDRDAGLAFELEGYTGCTLTAMRGWRSRGPEVLDVQLEEIERDFDGMMERVFRHLGLTEAECAMALDIAASEDISRMDDATLAANGHIHSRRLAKWRDVLSPAQIRMFERRYGDLITGLGYQLSDPSP
ncbi:MAG: hypothetical protein ACREF3_16620 [Acetobacteraceae bacterium]